MAAGRGSHLHDGGEQLVTGWHFHDVHEIEYACRGMVGGAADVGEPSASGRGERCGPRSAAGGTGLWLRVG